MGHSSSPKYPSSLQAQAELLIPIQGAGEEPAQRSQANRKPAFQTRTGQKQSQEQQRVQPDCARDKKGLMHSDMENWGRFPGGRKTGADLGRRRNRDEWGCPGSGVEPIVGS